MSARPLTPSLHVGPEEEIKLVTDSIVLEDIVVEENYDGPRMESDGEGGYRVTRQFVKDMIEAFRNQKKIHRRFAFQICIQVRAASAVASPHACRTAG